MSNNQVKKAPDQIINEYKNLSISTDLTQSIDLMERLLGVNDDFIIRRFLVFGKFKAVMAYFDFYNNKDDVQDTLKSFMYVPRHLEDKRIDQVNLKDILN